MTREEALKAITAFVENYACGSDLDGLREAIEALKAPTVERPHGEWIKANTEGQYKCSNCFGRHKDENGEWDETFDHTTYNFCPNCGASMSANDRQVTGKLNSEIEKSKSEIVPDYRDGWRLKEGDSDA